MAGPAGNMTVTQFLDGVEDEAKRRDSKKLVDLMKTVTGEEPRMWPGNIVGFGTYHYKYASGREGDAAVIGFSPRRQNLVIYLMSGFVGYEDLLQKLGKHTTGKACLYLKRLDKIDETALAELLRRSVAHVKAVESRSGGLPRMADMPPPPQ
ncbi:MAG TPA: DUF1801 domain-containing protein [Acidimicrobiia bacterium]|nr:DUF1801 domain-containing protein [Acidimicrobiia bacterium]